MQQPTWILGVDAGGTKTVAKLARLVSHDQPFEKAIEQVGEGRAGPGNPMAVGYPSALANLYAAIEAACSLGQITPRELSAACLGVAGAGRVEVQQRLLSLMKDELRID